MSNRRKLRGLRTVPVIENRRYMPAIGRDMEYFALNPHAVSYTRPATKDELKRYSLPPGTECAVVRVDGETHVRMFRTPSGGMN